MSTATATNQRTTPNGLANAVLKPGADVRGRLVNLLLLSTLAGTAWSVVSTSSATTAFRSRLPAHTLTRLQSSQTAFPVPSLPFFADKRNPLNQLFVKRSWGWVTALFLALSLTLYLFHPHHPSTSNPPSLTTSSRSSSSSGLTPTSRHLLASLRRYLLATLFWFYLTQATWFGTRLGPSIAFRILRSSGAVCVPSAVSSDPHGVGSAGGLHGDGGGQAGSAPVCTGARGEYWRGGHDVSGHAFMMVHAAMFLFEIVYPLLPSLFPSLFAAPPPPSDESTKDGADEGKVTRPGVAPRRINPVVAAVGYAIVAVLVLCWWMLLMTSLFFHSPAEKLTGLAFGLLGWYVSSL